MFVAALLIAGVADVNAAMWAKDAVALDLSCVGNGARSSQIIPSSSPAIGVQLRCEKSDSADEAVLLQVIQGARRSEEIVVSTKDAAWRPEEVYWAPDASAFVINGSPSAYAGFAFARTVKSSIPNLNPKSSIERPAIRNRQSAID